MTTPALAHVIAILAILFVGFVSNATFGFGAALIAMPLMALFLDLKTASPLMAMSSVTLALIILSRNWRDVHFSSIWRLMLGATPGIAVGAVFLKGVYEPALKLVLAAVIAGFAVYLMACPRMPRVKGEKSAYLSGFISGILGAAYNTNGPPLVIFGTLKGWEPRQFRATLIGVFFFSGILINVSHACSGLWTPTVLRLYVMALPAVLLAVPVGGWLHARIPPGRFDRCIQVLLIAIGLLLGVQTIRGMLAA